MKGQRAEELHLPRRNNPADARSLLCPAWPRGDASSSLPPEPLGGVVLISKALRGLSPLRRAPCGVVLLLPASSPSVTPAFEARGGLLARRCQHLAAGSIFEPTSLPPSIALARDRRGCVHFGAGAILSAFSWDAGAKPEAAAVPGARWMEAELGRGGGNLGVQDSVGELCAPNGSALKRCQPAAGVPGCCAPSACFMG